MNVFEWFCDKSMFFVFLGVLGGGLRGWWIYALDYFLCHRILVRIYSCEMCSLVSCFHLGVGWGGVGVFLFAIFLLGYVLFMGLVGIFLSIIFFCLDFGMLGFFIF